jgi:hypothetical protein
MPHAVMTRACRRRAIEKRSRAGLDKWQRSAPVGVSVARATYTSDVSVALVLSDSKKERRGARNADLVEIQAAAS